MASVDPSQATKNANVYRKKVTWLELFFDLIFALALAMSAKPLENIHDFSWSSFSNLFNFLLIFFFLIMFWYRHMSLINRFDHTSFFTTIITLAIGFVIIAFTQFIRIWTYDPAMGSFLATFSISLAVFLIAFLYFFFSKKIVPGGSNEKIWAAAEAKHMFLEALFYFAALFLGPTLRPFGLAAIFIYFNRYPFETYLNPRKQTTLPPQLVNIPMENSMHKTERMGLFALLVYGLVIILAAGPLFEIGEVYSVEEALGPVINFGKILFFISMIWYIQYALIEVIQPKGNRFTVMIFIELALLVASTHFIQVLFEYPSEFISIFFAITIGLLITVKAVSFFNIKSLAGVTVTDRTAIAFKQWSYLLYAAAGAFFVSVLFPTGLRELIWGGITAVVFLAAFVDGRIRAPVYYMGTRDSKFYKFFDDPTVTGGMFVGIGVVMLFIFTKVLDKEVASIWTLLWALPALVGFFIILNNWLHNRIK